MNKMEILNIRKIYIIRSKFRNFLKYKNKHLNSLFLISLILFLHKISQKKTTLNNCKYVE